MKSINFAIAENLLVGLKQKFKKDFSNVPEIRLYYHNLTFLFFSQLNGARLFSNKNNIYKEMVDLGLMPEYLYSFYKNEKEYIANCIDEAVKLFNATIIEINDFRQELLNIEMDFSNNSLSFHFDKISRDSTGSYYTPSELAYESLIKSLKDYEFKSNHTYKIADLSCGCGDFLLAAIKYLDRNCHIEPKTTAKWLYGVDIDPIALQICITNILVMAESKDWKDIIAHFSFGNPLLLNESITSVEDKNYLFATMHFYSSRLGLTSTFFEQTFDIIIGNPPWEKIRFEERKFFKGIAEYISSLPQKNSRQAEIEKLHSTWPVVYNWVKSLSTEYSLMTRGKYNHSKIAKSVQGELNTYALFSELAYRMLSPSGISALVVKSTLVTAPAHQNLWNLFVKDKAVYGVYLFDNRNKIFDIDSRERFAVIVLRKTKSASFEFIAGLTTPKDINGCKGLKLNEKNLVTLNPYTKTIPNVSNTDEIHFLLNIHNQFDLFADIYPNAHFGRLIHLTAHSDFIDKSQSSDNIPIYEGKFIEQYDARYATFAGMTDSQKYSSKATATRNEGLTYREKSIPESRFFVQKALWDKYQKQYDKPYSLCWRSLTSPTNRRTMLAMILPTCPTCQSIQMLQINSNEEILLLLGLFNSIEFDYLVRNKMPGLDLTQSVIRQIPVPSEKDYNKTIFFNNIEATIKTHILSLVVSLLQEESRLSSLVNCFESVVYPIDGKNRAEKQQLIDLLFKEAYHLDNESYRRIIDSFPKYSV